VFVGEWTAEDDEAGVDERAHVRGVLRPLRLGLDRRGGVPARPARLRTTKYMVVVHPTDEGGFCDGVGGGFGGVGA
jgi:hypothetical protein